VTLGKSGVKVTRLAFSTRSFSGRTQRELGQDQFTRLVEDEGRTLEEAILVSGHDSIAIPQRHYFSQKPEKFHTGRRLQIAPPAPMPLAA